jgi:hypothetical protein
MQLAIKKLLLLPYAVGFGPTATLKILSATQASLALRSVA